MNKLISSICLVSLILCVSCAKKNQGEVEVYNNLFEDGNLSGIQNGQISVFNGSHVLGNYNNDGFNLTVNDLPEHTVIDISFDLYIHDSWEGVQSIRDQSTGPDIWQMYVDQKIYINTTFANFDCIPGNFCPPQSYPANYPSQSNNPKTGASRTDLPGFCSDAGKPDGTTLYTIHKRVSHTGETVTIRCLDILKEKNVSDPKCNESWSVDNIKIKAVNLN